MTKTEINAAGLRCEAECAEEVVITPGLGAGLGVGDGDGEGDGLGDGLGEDPDPAAEIHSAPEHV